MHEHGKDLIFVSGTPGSRWSATIRSLSYNSNVNMSDEFYASEDAFSVVLTKDGSDKKHAWHRGAYWGPHHKQGHKFDKMNEMSKEEILEEILKPFDNKPGVKVIKSHWFAYHLDFIAKTFPQAKIMGVYLPDDICFDWWKLVGGWNITYPIYTWYENDDRMQEQIKQENSHLVRFFSEKAIQLKRYFSVLDLYHDLSLPSTFRNDVDISIFDEFDKDIAIGDEKFEKITNKRTSKVMLGIYNPSKHTINNVYEETLTNNPKGFDYDPRSYKKVTRK